MKTPNSYNLQSKNDLVVLSVPIQGCTSVLKSYAKKVKSEVIVLLYDVKKKDEKEIDRHQKEILELAQIFGSSFEKMFVIHPFIGALTGKYSDKVKIRKSDIILQKYQKKYWIINNMPLLGTSRYYYGYWGKENLLRRFGFLSWCGLRWNQSKLGIALRETLLTRMDDIYSIWRLKWKVDRLIQNAVKRRVDFIILNQRLGQLGRIDSDLVVYNFGDHANDIPSVFEWREMQHYIRKLQRDY